MNKNKGTVDYGNQCPRFSDNSVERCALCSGHPGKHKFPVTDQRNEAIQMLEDVRAWFAEWNVEIGPAEDSLLNPIDELVARYRQPQPTPEIPKWKLAAQEYFKIPSPYPS